MTRIGVDRRWLVIGGPIGAVLVIILYSIGWLAPINGVLAYMLAPMQRGLYGLGITVRGWYTPNTENPMTVADLQQRVTDLTVENAQLRTLIDQRIAAQEQVDFLKANGYRAVSAHVIGRDIQPTTNTLIIDQGAVEGIVVGLPVITGAGILVGRVASVKDHVAHITLITDNQSAFAATVQNQQRTQGKLVGDRGASLRLELIPLDAAIAAGNTVVTSGLEATTPRGLVIGRIEQVIAEPNSFFKAALVRSLVKPEDVIMVSVIQPTYE